MRTPLTRRTFLAFTAASMLQPMIVKGEGAAGALSLWADEPKSADAPAGRKNAGVIDLSRSRFAKLKSVPVSAVVIEDGFWSRRRKTNVASSIPTMHDELVAHGRMNNFLRLSGKSSTPQVGPVYSDSDI
ncbi:MAG TPA: hypothetical protein VGG26_08270, partial [Terracidiphilus sp.]